MRLQIFFTNDLHSRYEQMGKMSSILKNQRKENSLLFDTGDHADFMRLETEGTQGKISAHLMNTLQYDGFCFGNNEGFFTLKYGQHYVPECSFPTITCNLYTLDKQKLPYLQDYYIINKFGHKILVLGVTAPYNQFYELFRLYASEPKQELQKILTQLKTSEFDLIILLSHLGFEADKQIAEEFPQIHLIIGGHSHTILHQPFTINQIPIVQAGKYGQFLGKIEIEFNLDEKRVEIVEYELIDVNSYPVDPVVSQIISECKEIAIHSLEKPLYNLPIQLDHSIDKEANLGNFLADSLKHLFDAVFGFINSGVINKSIQKGMISKKLLHEVCPSPLNPALLKMNGKHVLDSIILSLDPTHCYKNGAGSGFRGKYIGFLCMSHNVKVSFTKSVRNEDEPKISHISVEINGKPLVIDQEYLIATSDYLERGSGYPDLKHNTLIKYHSDFLRDTLEKYLNNSQVLELSNITRYEEIKQEKVEKNTNHLL